MRNLMVLCIVTMVAITTLSAQCNSSCIKKMTPESSASTTTMKDTMKPVVNTTTPVAAAPTTASVAKQATTTPVAAAPTTASVTKQATTQPSSMATKKVTGTNVVRTKSPKSAVVEVTGVDAFIKAADVFLGKYVSEGAVAYSKIRENKKELGALIAQIGAADLSKVSSVAQQAFYINAYNLLVINSIVNHTLSSPLDRKTFFSGDEYKVAGKSLTLDKLEKGVLADLKKDPRFHFVLVCGAKGCPRLENFAYKASSLDSQLDAQTRRALNDPNFIMVKDGEQKVLLSEIFKWYTADFTTGGKTLVDYINKYRKSSIPSTYAVDYYTYDWKINGK